MDNKSMAMALGAALMFALGGVCMKQCEGLTKLWPTCSLFGLFLGGAVLNALILHRGGELGVAYLVVIGCETIMAFALGALIYHEQVTATKLFAVALIGVGTLVLAKSEQTPITQPGSDRPTVTVVGIVNER